MPEACAKAQHILSTQIQLQGTWKSGQSIIHLITMDLLPYKREGEKQPENLSHAALPLGACPLHLIP